MHWNTEEKNISNTEFSTQQNYQRHMKVKIYLDIRSFKIFLFCTFLRKFLDQGKRRKWIHEKEALTQEGHKGNPQHVEEKKSRMTILLQPRMEQVRRLSDSCLPGEEMDRIPAVCEGDLDNGERGWRMN